VILAQRRDRPVQQFEPFRLVGPDERLQQQRAFLGRHVDGSEIDADTTTDSRPLAQELVRNGPALLAAQLQPGSGRPPFAGPVDVAVPIPDEVQPRARADLDQIQLVAAAPPHELEEARQQYPAPLDLVRLDGPLGNRPSKEIRMLLQCRVDAVPRSTAAQDESVQSAEQPERRVPGGIEPDERINQWLVRKPPAELRIQRRAGRRRVGLVEKDLAPSVQLARADFACSAIAAKASGSDTARSASTFRSRPISALRQPAMNWL
jgi:hypothetical protein